MGGSGASKCGGYGGPLGDGGGAGASAAASLAAAACAASAELFAASDPALRREAETQHARLLQATERMQKGTEKLRHARQARAHGLARSTKGAAAGRVGRRGTAVQASRR